MFKKLGFVLILFSFIVTSNILSATGQSITVQPVATVTWEELVKLDATQAKSAALQQRVVPFLPGPGPREIGTAGKNPRTPNEILKLEGLRSAPADITSGLVPIGNFMALGDNNLYIPPDTHGAAGPAHLMTMLNTQVRIQNKTGGITSTTSLAGFWAPAGGSGPFDPRIIYDPLSNRWLAICDAGAFSTSSAVLFAISSTNNPTGTWTFYNIDADPTNVGFADYPDIGVNSTWIAITNNMFNLAGTSFLGAAMWVIDKSTALAGGPLTITAFPALFDFEATFGTYGFTLRPCLTFDAAQPKLYIVDNSGWNVAGLFMLRLSEITGTGPAPVWSTTAGSLYAGTGLFFVANNFDFAQIDAAQSGTASLVETNDPRMLNAVFRNGRVWCTHSAGLPIGAVDRTAVFWYQLDPTAMPAPIVQSGVLDGGAGVHHFFPSITANANDDVLLGFSRSDATKFVEAVYTGRSSTDLAGTMDPISVLKLGEDSYIKDFGTGSIRWGDYSATCVDPTTDLCMWTIQEYAAMDVGPGPSDDRWGTWWAQVCPCIGKPGDADASNSLDLADIQATVNYIFGKPGWPPCLSNAKICWLRELLCRGDWDGDGDADLADVIRGVNYIFKKPGWPSCPANNYTCWLPPTIGACCVPPP